MTLADATLIGVGAMIGAGIFVLIGIAAGVAGPALLVAFLLNGLVALLTAMSYAELGSCFHDAGGGYLWVKEGLPKWNGFLSGWMSWFAHAVACSLYAIGFGAYFEFVINEFGFVVPHWGFLSPQKVLAAVVAMVFAYINFRGASETGKVGNFVTIAKIVILAIFVGFGLSLMFGKSDWTAPFTPFMTNGWGGVFKAMGLTFIAFQGFEVIAQSSEEIQNPQKNIPRATFLSLLIVVPIYLLVAVAALGSVNPGTMTPWDYLAKNKELALVAVARHFFYGGGVMILVGGLISTMSALNATVYSSSRVAFALGRDRNFPGFFSRVHHRNFTPHWAILISLVIIVLMAVSLPIEDVASAADIMFLLLFLQVNIAMIRLRKKRPDLDRGFLVPLFPWITVIGIVLLLFLAVYMLNYSLVAWIVTGVWIAIGLVVYRFYASGREIEHVRKVRALERIEKKEYSIMVSISSPRTVGSLTQIALSMAKKHQAKIIFLHVIEVEEGQKLASRRDVTEEVRALFEKAEELADNAGISHRSLIKLSHRISQGIVDTALEEECNFIVIGRLKKPNFLDRIFSTLIYNVLQKSPSEAAILHGEFPPGGVRNILIPYGSNIHTRLALEVAPALAEFFRAKIQIAVVFEYGVSKPERDAMIHEIQDRVEEYSLDADIAVVKERDVLQGILRLSRKADLVLMGGRTGGHVELLFAESLTRDITEQVVCPVLWVKEYEEHEPFWRSLLWSRSHGGKGDQDE
ncbi:MAG TPA: amino acid permease [Deltaproteobacteria bacterium]|nr:amino acid permease [Deltaproteobacteria bacterium]